MGTTDGTKTSNLCRLPPSTVKLLSSGQVITSVSTAVKELLENAIDAGASSIEITLENEGFDKIEVKDNGNGIICEDVPYMCQCRYTSKIRDFADLENLNSYGFRGEALSSLCAISQLSVTTKTINDEVATCYSFDNEGKVISSRMSHLNVGTIITVQGLFKNLPVRKQYLTNGRRKAAELNAIANIVKSFGLIHPKLRIVLSHNKFRIWHKTSVNSLQESLVQVIPHTIAKNLHEIIHVEDNLKINLMVPSKDCYVWNTCYGLAIDPVNIFVNTRPIRNKSIQKAVLEEINQFFGSTIPKNKNPFCLISITLPTNFVDVNLEPNKTKVIVKDMDHVVRSLKDQLVNYYIGPLEPPKPSNDTTDNTEINLKRKNKENTPKKSKIAKKMEKYESMCSRKSENGAEEVEENNENKIDSINNSYSLDTSDNDLYVTVMEEGDSPIKMKENHNDLDSVSNNNIETSIADVEMSKIAAKSITTSIENSKSELDSSAENCDKRSDNNDQLVGIISNDESSNDSFIDEVLQRISTDLEDSLNRNKSSINTSIQNKTVESSKNLKQNGEIVSKPDVNMEEITLSQWSRGDVKLNGEIIESSTKIVNKEDLVQRKVDNSPSFSVTNGVSSQGNRSISSQMGCKQMAGFTKFARDMRKKIIEQTPGITFTAVAAELASKWRNLRDDEKLMYDCMAKEKPKEKPKAIKLPNRIKDPTYRPKTISVRYNPPQERKFTKTESLNLSIEKLRMALQKRVHYQPPSLDTVATLESDGLLICDKKNIILASIGRMKESIVLHKNLEQMKIPVRVLDSRIPILQSDLGPDLWNVMVSLETHFDDNFKTIINIADQRITDNGYRIETIPGGQEDEYYLTEVPLELDCCDLNEVKEILQSIKANNNVKLNDCRPNRIFNFIKNESLKDTSLMNYSDCLNVLEMYSYWSDNVKDRTRNCPHFRPVSKILYSF